MIKERKILRYIVLVLLAAVLFALAGKSHPATAPESGYRLRAGIIEVMEVHITPKLKMIERLSEQEKARVLVKAADNTKQEPITIQGKIGVKQPVSADITRIPSNVPNGESGCKSYKKTHMGYKTITCKTSPQYGLQQEAYTDEESGIRMVDDCYLVAVGSYYADHVGEKLLVTMESGKQVLCMVGEFKSNRHTDPSHRYHTGGYEDGIYYPGDGSVLEFVVDSSIYSPDKIPEVFDGKIHSITKAGSFA